MRTSRSSSFLQEWSLAICDYDRGGGALSHGANISLVQALENRGNRQHPMLGKDRKARKPKQQGNSMLIIPGRHGGGGKRRREENLTNDTPPKKGFWNPPSYSTFSTPLRCQCSVFPVQNPRQSRPEAPKIFGSARSLVRVPPPIRFAPPHITAQHQARIGISSVFPPIWQNKDTSMIAHRNA